MPLLLPFCIGSCARQSKVTGKVVVNSRRPVEHTGVSLTVEGQVTMQLSAKSVGLFEAFYSPAKPIQMLSKTIDLKVCFLPDLSRAPLCLASLSAPSSPFSPALDAVPLRG